MQTRGLVTRKVTISMPLSLLQYADRQAEQLRTSRSAIISQALAQAKAVDEDRLAAEGYRFYAHEATEFATASASAFAEVLDDAG